MSNDGRQLSKAEPKWQAITSSVLGSLSILADVNIIIAYSRTLRIIDYISTSSLFGGWLFAAVGFIFGIMGLKYTRNKLAIAGIVLSVIGFVAYVYLYFMALRIGQQ